MIPLLKELREVNNYYTVQTEIKGRVLLSCMHLKECAALC